MKYGTTAWGVSAAHVGTSSLSQDSANPAAAWLESVDDIAPAPHRPYWSSVRIVSLLAFGQSLVFLILWLFVCAGAGAGTLPKPVSSADLQLSVYQPTKQRDPFGKVGGAASEVKAVPGAPVSLQLEGILYQTVDPSAIVNGQLLTLNKSVNLKSAAGEVSVTAVEITRDRVVVEASGQRIELRLNSPNATAATTP